MSETEKPLAGRHVLLTREHSQVAALAGMLRKRGAYPVECPLIAFQPPEDWGPADRCMERLDRYQGFLFTSVNAVASFFERLQATGINPAPLESGLCFAVGPATAAALRARGLRVRALPDRYQAEGLCELLDREHLSGKRFLFPRARDARDVLIRHLEARGVPVDLAVVYETRMASENRQRLHGILASGNLDYITFTSTSTARFFGEMAGRDTAGAAWAPVPVACIGQITARAARELGFRQVLTAARSTLQGLVDVLVQHAGAR